MLRITLFLAGLVAFAPAARAQLIDFETLPDSSQTTDTQVISTEYAPYGVTFSLVDPVTGAFVGYPRIAKSGTPLTAFAACWGDDTPAPGEGYGESFLTDNTYLGIASDLLVTYLTPVRQSSGALIDTDCREPAGNPPCEQWTIQALDATGAVLEAQIIDAPVGGANPECPDPNGVGDGRGIGWLFDRPSADIAAVKIRYTGQAANVGIAFDNFSPVNLGSAPKVAVISPADSICLGEALLLRAEIRDGLPPFAYQWQERTGPDEWIDLGTQMTQEVTPSADAAYRLRVTDQLLREGLSDPVDVTVLPLDAGACQVDLLVSSFYTNSVEAYGGMIHGLHRQFVAAGSGGLTGAAGLICGPDGELYVGSQTNHSVLRYDGTTGAFVDVFVSSGSGGLSYPVELLFMEGGDLLVASSQTHQVLRYRGDSGAYVGPFVASGSGGLSTPTGMAIGPDGNLYVSSRGNNRILRYNGATGAFIDTFVPSGSGGLAAPRGLAFGPDLDLFVGEETGDRVLRFNGRTGAFIEIFIAAGSGGLDRANDVLFGTDGNLLVASFNTDQVLRYDRATRAFLGVAAQEGLDGPAFMALSCSALLSGVPGPASARVDPEFAVERPLGLAGPVVFRYRPGQDVGASIAVYNVGGRLVRELAIGGRSGNSGAAFWDLTDAGGRHLPAGIYFARLTGQGVTCARSRKVLLLK